ncbi:MAG: hypothetical protein QXU82_02400 [Candidatus Aenigmatarchaeota archaeon]
MANMLPIYFIRSADVPKEDYDAVMDAARDILKISGGSAVIKDFGVWRQPNWRDADGKLTRWNSVDWYVQECLLEKDKGFGRQVDASKINDLFGLEPWRKAQDHYDFAVLGSDITSEDWGTNFVLGGASRGIGTVISLKRFSTIRPEEFRQKVVKTLAYHEIGHVFGAPDGSRRNVVQKLGRHCDEYGCSMQQGMSVSEFVQHTKERLEKGEPYCSDCKEDIREYVRRAD